MNWQDRGSHPRMTYAAMRAAGIAADEVYATLGVTAAQLHAPDFTYPHESCAEFWRQAERISGDADVGLTVGRHMPSYHGELLEYLYLSSPDFGTGLARGIAYNRLISDGMEGRVGEDADGAFLSWRSKSALVNDCRHHFESTTLGLLRFFREITEGAFSPRRIEFTCGAPATNLALREQLFGCTLRYGAQENRIYFDPDLLTRPSPHAEAELFRMHDRVASERLQRIVARDFVAEVQTAIGSMLELGEVTVEVVARQLRLTPAVVRTRLTAAGASFQQELDGYRHRLACKLLAETEQSMRDVCYLTGFSEPATFYRAFRRWENDTPANYRQRHRSVAQSA